jgi:integrase
MKGSFGRILRLRAAFCSEMVKVHCRQSGDKNQLASLIAQTAQRFPLQTVAHIGQILADIEEHEAVETREPQILVDGILRPIQTRDRNSKIRLPEEDFKTWEWLGDQVQMPAQAVVRRIASAYARNPVHTRSHISGLLALLPQPKDLEVLYAAALTSQQIKALLSEIATDATSPPPTTAKGWQRMPFIPARTNAILLLSLLTALRNESLLNLCYKHLALRADGAFVIATPSMPGRQYVVSDRRFHAALHDFFAAIGERDTYQRIEQGQLSDSEDSLWPAGPNVPTAQPPRQGTGLARWAFYKPLNRYAERLDMGPIAPSKLLATHAWLLSRHLHDPLAVRCHLLPIGDRVTDAKIHLP